MNNPFWAASVSLHNNWVLSKNVQQAAVAYFYNLFLFLLWIRFYAPPFSRLLEKKKNTSHGCQTYLLILPAMNLIDFKFFSLSLLARILLN